MTYIYKILPTNICANLFIDGPNSSGLILVGEAQRPPCHKTCDVGTTTWIYVREAGLKRVMMEAHEIIGRSYRWDKKTIFSPANNRKSWHRSSSVRHWWWKLIFRIHQGTTYKKHQNQFQNIWITVEIKIYHCALAKTLQMIVVGPHSLRKHTSKCSK